MGQESSSLTLETLAEYIVAGKARKIIILSGAGISTSAGIPDFRSPKTGLYANLSRLDLPFAEAVFHMDYFRQNPAPFYELASELYPGKFRPTITHSFITLLQRKGLLLMHFTQNIDCLDREAGLPAAFTVEAHGSFAKQRCIDCGEEYPDDEMLRKVRKKEVPHCKVCYGLVKPDIVFFGEQLPAKFFANVRLPYQADLCIVMGTSLEVGPFNQLPEMVPQHVPRLLINRDRVGSLGSRPGDLLLLTDCDDGVRRLAEECGWLEELEALWEETGEKFPGTAVEEKGSVKEKTKDEILQEEIDRLNRDVERTLRLADQHMASIQSSSQSFRSEPTQTSSSRKETADVEAAHSPDETSTARKLLSSNTSTTDAIIQKADSPGSHHTEKEKADVPLISHGAHFANTTSPGISTSGTPPELKRSIGEDDEERLRASVAKTSLTMPSAPPTITSDSSNKPNDSEVGEKVEKL